MCQYDSCLIRFSSPLLRLGCSVPRLPPLGPQGEVGGGFHRLQLGAEHRALPEKNTNKLISL